MTVATLTQELRDATAPVLAQLASRQVPHEGLAEYRPAKSWLMFTKPATMQKLDSVWRLGVFLLTVEGELYFAGHTTRAAERLRPNHQDVSREIRRDIAAAAKKGGYPEGFPVNYDAVPVPNGREELLALPHTAALFVDEARPSGSQLRVRWNPGAPASDAPGLSDYLAERVDLLLNSPRSDD